MASKKRKRARLARARRELQAKFRRASAQVVGLRGLGYFLPIIYLAFIPLLVRKMLWVRDYRRLKASLGLQDEYDELDEAVTWGGKFMLIFFGVIGGSVAVAMLIIKLLT